MQLFNSLDPTPPQQGSGSVGRSLYRKLGDAFSLEQPSAHHDHVEHLLGAGNATALMTEAIHNRFAYKAELAHGELRQLLRRGRASLFIGLAFVAVCLIAADAIAQLGSGSAATIARESLTILGWVAMWRPVEIFLYD